MCITLYFVVINETLFPAYHAYHPYIHMLNVSFDKVTMMRQFHRDFFVKDVTHITHISSTPISG